MTHSAKQATTRWQWQRKLATRAPGGLAVIDGVAPRACLASLGRHCGARSDKKNKSLHCRQAAGGSHLRRGDAVVEEHLDDVLTQLHVLLSASHALLGNDAPLGRLHRVQQHHLQLHVHLLFHVFHV